MKELVHSPRLQYKACSVPKRLDGCAISACSKIYKHNLRKSAFGIYSKFRKQCRCPSTNGGHVRSPIALPYSPLISEVVLACGLPVGPLCSERPEGACTAVLLVALLLVDS